MDLYRLTGPLIRLLDPERAHGLALWALKNGFVPPEAAVEDPSLRTTLWGLDFPNPVGLAAGFDKNAEVIDPMLGQGFGFVEVGSVTPEPQPGNPKPRLFRLSDARAVINRMGFNNDGLAPVLLRLLERKDRPGIVGVNLGKNKTQEDAIADYVKGVEFFAPLADYLVINVSSPNTPGLRALQSAEALDALLAAAMSAREAAPRTPPLLLKIAPDLTDEDKADIAVLALKHTVNGVIVSNTTIGRPDGLDPAHAAETGGLSGRPLFQPSTAMLGDFYRATEKRVPLVGVGGVENAATAYAKIKAGASLVQLYSALVFEGPALVARINRGLVDLLRADGFKSVSEAVGKDSS